MKTVATTEKRGGERFSSTLSAVVKVKDNKNNIWKEDTKLLSVSRSGAGFYLERHCQVGQLVSLMTAMPRHLRGYDTEKELYRVWGLVQHCSPVADVSSYHVGVAFVGKNAPESYHLDPLQSYRISGINADGLWKIIEAERPFVIRRYPRFYVPLDSVLALVDENDNVSSQCESVTENISLRGAAVFTELNANVGDCVRFTCDKYDFSALAVVRDRKVSGAGISRVHLEFITADFPVKEINFPSVPAEDGED